MKLTEKNAAMIMGRVNKFFEKDTKIYRGICKRKTGDIIKINGTELQFPVYEDYERYEPFIGGCNVHWLYKKKNNIKYKYTDELSADIPILAIKDKYSTSLIPLYVGNDIKITGDSLIVKDNTVIQKFYNELDGMSASIRIKEKSTYTYFYHMPISDEDKHEVIRKGICELYDISSSNCLLEEYEEDTDKNFINKLESIITMAIFDAIKNYLDMGEDKTSIRISPDFNGFINLDKDIYFNINIARIRDGIDNVKPAEVLTYTYGDNCITDLGVLLNQIFYDCHKE